MLLNYFRNLVTPRITTYEYALSEGEVKEALFKIAKSSNLQKIEFDVIGSFISENEFEYNLINIFDTNIIGITFPMRGSIITVDKNCSKIILQPRLKVYAYILLSLTGILVLAGIALAYINSQINFLIWAFAILIISPRLIKLYINSVSSALLIRYRKYMHTAILETYRTKHYGL